ncbi:MAG: hypothetical protein RBS13_04720, partial [Bacteroidales bacterium]|nr:hypothetical protein [Bacteroidales bacterium]
NLSSARLQSQPIEIALSIQRECNLDSTSMGAPYNESPISYEKDRHGVLMKVVSTHNRRVKGKR